MYTTNYSKGNRFGVCFIPIQTTFFFPKAQLSDAVTFDGRSGVVKVSRDVQGGRPENRKHVSVGVDGVSPPLLPV